MAHASEALSALDDPLEAAFASTFTGLIRMRRRS